jgi:hypothetical protein
MSVVESCTLLPERPRRTRRNPILRNFRVENLPPFGRVCVALYGVDKPGVALAQKAGCTPRQADLYIEGKTPPSYEVLMVVLDELRPRKRA